jgi:hypothetical protein
MAIFGLYHYYIQLVSDFKTFCASQLETKVPFHKRVSVTTDEDSVMFNKCLA